MKKESFFGDLIKVVIILFSLVYILYAVASFFGAIGSFLEANKNDEISE